MIAALGGRLVDRGANVDADRLVLVLAGEHDFHANRVRAELDALGVESALLDTSDYPDEISLAWDYSDQASLSLRLRGGRVVTEDKIGAV